MGAPAGAGGSDKSDEKKVDTYSDQLKKEQARKSKYKTNKFGYKVEKNIFEKIGDKHPVIQGVKNFSDKRSLNRRMKFANKKGINIQGLSTEQILSKDFKSKLEAKGYQTQPGNKLNLNTGPEVEKDPNTPESNEAVGRANARAGYGPAVEIYGADGNRYVEGGVNIGIEKPGSTESEETKTSDKKYDPRRTKKRGRSQNLLTSSKGVTKVSEDYSLGKKSLLGSV